MAAFGPFVRESWVSDRVAALLEPDDIRAGERIYGEGEPAEFIYFMRSGRVELTRAGAPPWQIEGRWTLGTFDAFVERSRTRTAVALEDLQLMKLRSDAWIDLLEDSFDLAHAAVTQSARVVAKLEAEHLARGGAPAQAASLSVALPEGRLNLVERLAVLLDLGMLRGAGVQTLVNLASSTTEVSFSEGQAVLERGAAREQMVLVMAGEVEASREDPHVVARYGPGTVVCDAAAFGEPSLAWAARAAAPTRALTIRVESWFDQMEEHFDLVRAFLGAAAVRREWLLEQVAAEQGELVMR